MAATITYSRRALWRRAWGLVRLVRPLNFVLFIVGVVVGGVLVAGPDAFRGDRAEALLLAALSAACIGGAANSLNDLFDLEIDRVNRPGRPLPAGAVAPGAARWVWAAGSAAGVILGFVLSVTHGVIALLSVALLYAYSARLKRTVGWGNLAVAVVVGLALLYGGHAAGAIAPALVGAAFAFLTTLVREIVKDIEDAEGDAAAGARTLPVAHGASVAARVAVALVLLTVALTPLPFVLLDYSGLYLLLGLVADLFLLGALWHLSQAAPADRASQASLLVKLAMMAGLAALAGAGRLAGTGLL